MNLKKVLSFSYVMLLLISIIACKNGGSGEAYDLKMRLADGDKFANKTVMDMDMSFEVMGSSVNSVLSVNTDYSFHVLGDSAHLKHIRLTYDTMHISMEMPNMPVDKNEMDSMLNISTKAMSNKSLDLYLDKSLNVVATSNFNELINIPSLPIETMKEIEKMYSPEFLNNSFSMFFKIYPDKPVKVGDSWTKKMTTQMGTLNMNVDSKFKLINVKDGVATLEVKGTIGGKGTINQQGMDLEMEMNGEQNGTINIPLATGYFKDGTIDYTLDANMKMMGQEVPMKMKMKVSE